MQQLSSTIRVLFVDFDGVMHPEFCHASAHFLHRDAFEGVMRMFSNVDLVISSTWRLQRTLPELKKLFSEDIAERLIGITPLYSQLMSIPETLVGYQREAECRAWLQANNRLTQPWVALDDRSWNFRPFNPRVFLVNGNVGLNEEAAKSLLAYMLQH